MRDNSLTKVPLRLSQKKEAKEHSVQKEDWIEYKPKCILVKSFDGKHLRENNKSFWSVQLKESPLLRAKLPLFRHCTRLYTPVNSTPQCDDVRKEKKQKRSWHELKKKDESTCTCHSHSWVNMTCWSLSRAKKRCTQEASAHSALSIFY